MLMCRILVCAGQHLPHWHLRASELVFVIKVRPTRAFSASGYL